ncbi:hypothetical protein AB9F29_19040 [Falsihalocynthiibacter sp. S25ZX9]
MTPPSIHGTTLGANEEEARGNSSIARQAIVKQSAEWGARGDDTSGRIQKPDIRQKP